MRDSAPLVVVAEHQADVRARCAGRLAALGCRVLVADHGEPAWRLAATVRPDLVLVGAFTRPTDGEALRRRLSTDERTRRVPVIALGALDEDFEALVQTVRSAIA